MKNNRLFNQISKLNINVFISLIFSFVFSILYFRNLSGVDYILFTATIAIFRLSNTFATLNLETYLKKIHLIKDKNIVKLELGNVLKTTLFLLLPIMVLALIFNYLLYSNLLLENLFSVSIFLVVSLILASFLKIIRQFILFSSDMEGYVDIEIKVNLILKSLLTIVLFYFVDNLVAALLINICNQVILYPGLLFFLRKTGNFPKFSKYKIDYFRKHIDFSFKVLIIESFPKFIYSIAAYLLLKKYDTEIVATASFVILIIQRVSQTFFIYMYIYNSEISAKLKMPKQIFQLIRKVFIFSLFIFTVTSLLLIIFESYVISYISQINSISNSFVFVFLSFFVFEILRFLSRLEVFLIQLIGREDALLKNSLVSLVVTSLIFYLTFTNNLSINLDILSFSIFYFVVIYLNHYFLKKVYFKLESQM